MSLREQFLPADVRLLSSRPATIDKSLDEERFLAPFAMRSRARSAGQRWPTPSTGRSFEAVAGQEGEMAARPPGKRARAAIADLKRAYGMDYDTHAAQAFRVDGAE